MSSIPDMENQKYNLDRIADIAMEEKGLLPFIPEEVKSEVDALTGPAEPKPGTKDLRDIEWISIDNDDSKDLDQITWTDGQKIYIAIADVDAMVLKDSSIDLYAKTNTTSVYTPTKIYPMLPVKLSTDLTSLNEDKDRLAIVTEIEVDDNGQFLNWNIYPAWVRNHHKLTYKKVGALLKENAPAKNALDEQLFLQSGIAQKIKDFRFRNGALDFNTAELKTSTSSTGELILEEDIQNLANELIENFMIASNVVMTKFLKEKNLPTFRRIVRVPKNWERIMEVAHELGHTLPSEPDNKALQAFITERKKNDLDHFPDLSLSLIKLIGRGEYFAGFPGKEVPGHFDLALLDYSHTTAPNRRYPDIITQRILKSYLYQSALPYTPDEMSSLADHCTAQEDAATKVERRMLKSAAALALVNKTGTRYEAMLTGKGEKGTWIRVISPPIEGKLNGNTQSLKVGDKLHVKLVSVNVERGFIDFAKV